MPRDVQQILADVRTLAKEYYTVTKRPLGVTAEIGEFEVARILDLKLAEAREPGYDAIDPNNGRKYQIKARALSLTNGKVNPGQKVGGIKLNHPWDAVLLILFNQSFEPVMIYEAERKAVALALAEPGSKARNIRGALSITKFKSIGRKVWPKD